MKIYEIYDEETERQVGILLYYEKEKACIIELPEYVDEWTAPLLLANYARTGIYTIPSDISFLWVKERVIPSGRQNIGDILSTHKLKEYDEMKFLEIAEGRCSQDNLCIRKLNILPEYVQERQEKNIAEVALLGGRKLLCFFRNEEVKKVNLNELPASADLQLIIENELLFKSGKVGIGGYAVCFNDSIEIPAGQLYEYGQSIPLSLDDFKEFVRQNVIDTSGGCDELECSRQNIAYMIKKEQLSVLKEDVKGNLYLKGDLLRNKW